MQDNSGKPGDGDTLRVHKASGQWSKRIKGHVYYFGAVATDPQGGQAKGAYRQRIKGILDGTDHMRVVTLQGPMTVGQLVSSFLADFREQVRNGKKSNRTLGDYIAELTKFVEAVKSQTHVAGLGPAHFAEYSKTFDKRSLGNHARRRVIAYVRACLNYGAAVKHGMGWYPPVNYGPAFIQPDVSRNAIRKEREDSGRIDNLDRIATGAEIDKLVKVATPLHKAIIMLAVNTGMGIADIGRLRWKHVNMQSGKLNMPRGKTLCQRQGYIWKRTRKHLNIVAGLRHNRRAIERDGKDALVFVTRLGQPMYREELKRNSEDRVTGVRAPNAVSGTFARLCERAKLDDGLTFYKLRHTFATYARRINDPDARLLCMGHESKKSSSDENYNHAAAANVIDFARIKRVALAVKAGLWPKPKEPKQPAEPVKTAGANPPAVPQLKIAG